MELVECGKNFRLFALLISFLKSRSFEIQNKIITKNEYLNQQKVFTEVNEKKNNIFLDVRITPPAPPG